MKKKLLVVLIAALTLLVSQTYADKRPYGHNSFMPKFYLKRNKWIKEEYFKLRKKKIPETECYTRITNKLSELRSGFFGKTIMPKNTKPFNLSTERVKFIIQSKKV